MGAQVLSFPVDPTGTRDARLILARSWSSDAEFHQARMHILRYGADADLAFACRASRERDQRRARARIANSPMPASPAASHGRERPARSGGNSSLPAMEPACSAHGATASAAGLSSAEALSIHAERWVTRTLVTIIAVCLAFLVGIHLGGAIATAAVPTL